jgi:hypothetical protein
MSTRHDVTRRSIVAHAKAAARYRHPMPSPRRFPPPWSVEDIGAAFVVKDSAGQKLAYVYSEDEPGRRSAAKLLTRDADKRLTWRSPKAHPLSGRSRPSFRNAMSARTQTVRTAAHCDLICRRIERVNRCTLRVEGQLR